MPPTDQIEASLAKRIAERALIPAECGTERLQLDRHISRLQEKLELATQRDALQADRPDGCWCLGLGGKDPGYLPSRTAEAIRDYGDVVKVWRTYCECSDGVAIKAREDLLRPAVQARLDAMQLRRIFPEGTRLSPRLMDYTFDSYPVAPDSAPTVDALRQWAEDIRDQRSIFLYGRVARGKTGLAAAALKARLLRQRNAGAAESSALFLTSVDLLDRIRATYGPTKDGQGLQEDDILKALKSADLLILDDLGKESVKDWVRERLFVIINARYEYKRPMLITSNFTPLELVKRLGLATVSRLEDMSLILHLQGPNLRTGADDQ